VQKVQKERKTPKYTGKNRPFGKKGIIARNRKGGKNIKEPGGSKKLLTRQGLTLRNRGRGEVLKGYT